MTLTVDTRAITDGGAVSVTGTGGASVGTSGGGVNNDVDGKDRARGTSGRRCL